MAKSLRRSCSVAAWLRALISTSDGSPRYSEESRLRISDDTRAFVFDGAPEEITDDRFRAIYGEDAVEVEIR